MTAIFEPRPRFKNAPPICIAENRLSFVSEKAIYDWLAKPGKGNPLYTPNRVVKAWLCGTCNHWHFITRPRPPSGDSSGSSRR